MLIAIAGVTTAIGGCSSLAWRAALKRPAGTSPADVTQASLEYGPLIIHADFALPRDQQLIGELAEEQTLICDRLGIPPGDAKIHVYLFADEPAYRRRVAAEFPDFPHRRAIFVEARGELQVYAHWNEHVAEDLRHEVAHGYLHAALPELPLWLDEGLAEFFEVGDGGRGLHAGHIEHLRSKHAAGQWQPDLERLARLESAADMTQTDYAEAWLWVHFMLGNSPGASNLLASYLSALAEGPSDFDLGDDLRRRLPDADSRVLEHLATLGR